MSNLPIYEVAEAIVSGVKKFHRAVVQAPTGSGKSTQVPQILDRAGVAADGQILILQPRRLAARLLAARVAEEMGVRLGEEVGYQIRFEDRASKKTRVNFVTEGILMRKLIADPSLSAVSTVIFDEFHERHLYADLSLARCRLIQRQRAELNLVVMSATLDADRVEKFLEPCAVVESAGRQFSVSVEYLEKPLSLERGRIWDAAAEACVQAAARHADGDVLIFMPGAYEIQRTIAALGEQRAARDWTLAMLHGELPPERQNEALRPCGGRKVIVATNVAETSITIPTVRVVIDSGLARVNRFDPRRGINTLMVEKISRASAEQRKGRAGRVADGHCVRLWTGTEHMLRPASETPEIHRVDLAESVLLLKGGGIVDLEQFPWFEPPDGQTLRRAARLLEDLGALHEADGTLTVTGRELLRYPVHPRYARMLHEARRRGCVPAVCAVAALAQGKNIFRRNVSRSAEELRDDLFGGEETSDFFLQLRALKFAENKNFDFNACDKPGIDAAAARQASQLSRMFLGIAQRRGDAEEENEKGAADGDAIRRCILAGFADQVARRLDQGSLRCEVVHGRKGELARESVVRKAPLIVAAEISEIQRGTGEVVTLLNQATAVDEAWLAEVSDDAIVSASVAAWDATQRRVITERRVSYHDLLLRREIAQEASASAAAEILVEKILDKTLTLKGWDDDVEKFLLRVRFLAGHAPELGYKPFADADRRAVLEQFCLGATAYKDIKEKPALPFVRDWLSPSLSAGMAKLAPERVEVRGKSLKISYAANEPPSLSATIQDLYDLTETPRILGGKLPLTVKILAPSRRPVQVTQDLASFWREGYPKVKPELQRRYPRHVWR
ncbi:MAG: ATP-dependent helicase HrpB [Verrucomicrobiales bacterium]|jgi:ATP-dependent helicase HrpB|nr:ATP-dependent helicase HrpB [Verrucomicrobiales bacterium]